MLGFTLHDVEFSQILACQAPVLGRPYIRGRLAPDRLALSRAGYISGPYVHFRCRRHGRIFHR